MITQEEIPYTKEEIKAMVKTIAQLRKEKKELLDKVCEWLKENLIKETSCIASGVGYISFNSVISKLKEAMEK